MLENTDLIKMNLQLFGDEEQTQDETRTPEPAPAPRAPAPAPATPAPQGKTFSEDYVQALREEAKTNRIAKKNTELKLKELLGLKEDEDLTDDRIKQYKEKAESERGQALSKANERLIMAEIKSLDGYDAKLVNRLLDRSTLTVEEDGTVKGLTEALTELEKDFPQIKSAVKGSGNTNPAHTTPLIGLDALKAEWKKAMETGNLAQAISLKNQIFEMETKQ